MSLQTERISKFPRRINRINAPLFYAVARGRNPGVFTSWEACAPEVMGFGSALFKKFENEAAAINFVKLSNPAFDGLVTSQARVPVPLALGKYYAVKNGRVPGIYLSHLECLEQVDKFSGAIYKKFNYRPDAESFMKQVYERYTVPGRSIKAVETFRERVEKEDILTTPLSVELSEVETEAVQISVPDPASLPETTVSKKKIKETFTYRLTTSPFRRTTSKGKSFHKFSINNEGE